jgi:hypothetical protein
MNIKPIMKSAECNAKENAGGKRQRTRSEPQSWKRKAAMCNLFRRKLRIIPFPVAVYGQPEQEYYEIEKPPRIISSCKIISFEYRNFEFDHPVEWPKLPPNTKGKYKLDFIWDHLPARDLPKETQEVLRELHNEGRLP